MAACCSSQVCQTSLSIRVTLFQIRWNWILEHSKLFESFPLLPRSPSLDSHCAASYLSPIRLGLQALDQTGTRPCLGRGTRAVLRFDDRPMGWSHLHTSLGHCAPLKTIGPFTNSVKLWKLDQVIDQVIQVLFWKLANLEVLLGCKSIESLNTEISLIEVLRDIPGAEFVSYKPKRNIWSQPFWFFTCFQPKVFKRYFVSTIMILSKSFLFASQRVLFLSRFVVSSGRRLAILGCRLGQDDRLAYSNVETLDATPDSSNKASIQGDNEPKTSQWPPDFSKPMITANPQRYFWNVTQIKQTYNQHLPWNLRARASHPSKRPWIGPSSSNLRSRRPRIPQIGATTRVLVPQNGRGSSNPPRTPRRGEEWKWRRLRNFLEHCVWHRCPIHVQYSLVALDHGFEYCSHGCNTCVSNRFWKWHAPVVHSCHCWLTSFLCTNKSWMLVIWHVVGGRFHLPSLTSLFWSGHYRIAP